jgi:hypothetical protein
MKSFKFFLLSFFGSLLALGAIFFFTIMLIVGIASSSNSKNIEYLGDGFLKISLSGELPSYTPPDEFDEIFDETKIDFHKVLFSIKSAATDANIHGIVLEPSAINFSFAEIRELKSALVKFKKESGKPVYSYLTMADNKDYMLSTVSDKIFMAPESYIYLHKFELTLTFIKNSLKKLGIEADYLKVGKYKYEAFQYRTNNFTSSDTEKILLKELDKTNISETLRANLQLELSRLLLKTNDFERANYYFNHINSALLEPFEYELVKLKLEKSDFHLALINLFKKFKFDNKFYVFLEKNLKKQKKKKRISILQGMYKSEKEHYAKLHIAYLLYRQYKSMVSSKSRNKALKRYSDLCYVHLRKAQF